MRMKRVAILSASVALALILVVIVSIQNSDGSQTANYEGATAGCVYKIEDRTVRGTSMTGVIEDGSNVRILFGYYRCNEIMRNDIVAYNFSGDPNPIVKIIKGLPGDRFHLQKTNGGWNVLINGGILRNSQNQSYLLDESGYRVLSLYERDYSGAIPAGSYLILGNLASGSLDSSRFGLVDKGGIIGKAVQRE